MRPILLNGHERALTKLQFNADGDLLFTVSKDKSCSVWFAHSGVRLGTFDGHDGSIWDIDVNHTSVPLLLTAGADSSVRLWEGETGQEVGKIDTKSPVRGVMFSESGNRALYVTDQAMGEKSMIHVVDIKNRRFGDDRSSIIIEISKATQAKWINLDTEILVGHNDGTLSIYGLDGVQRKSERKHTGSITDIQFGHTKDYFVSSSKDCSAIVWRDDLQVWKKFVTERPVNSAALSPLKPQLILGGGQDAMDVTTTVNREGFFETRFYHLIFEDEIGRVKGHFGPVNTLAFSPCGKGYASGGEDGFVRMHWFGEDYFEFQYAEEKY